MQGTCTFAACVAGNDIHRVILSCTVACQSTSRVLIKRSTHFVHHRVVEIKTQKSIFAHVCPMHETCTRLTKPKCAILANKCTLQTCDWTKYDVAWPFIAFHCSHWSNKCHERWHPIWLLFDLLCWLSTLIVCWNASFNLFKIIN